MKTEKDLVVPQGMLEAASVAWAYVGTHSAALLAALEWLAKNPVTPEAMVDQVACMIWSFNLDSRPEQIKGQGSVWTEEHESIKRIYRDIARIACQITFAQAFKPEPEIPKDLADLVLVGRADMNINMSAGGLNALLLEAYARGKQAQPKIIEQAMPASPHNRRD